MKCPQCGSKRLAKPHFGPTKWRRPIEYEGWVWRVHTCLECGRMMLSKQRIVRPSEVEARAQAHELEMLKRLLAQTEDSNDSQTTFSGLTPADVENVPASTYDGTG